MEASKIIIRLGCEIRILRSTIPDRLFGLFEERLTWRNPLFGKTERFGKPLPPNQPEHLTGIRLDPATGDVCMVKGFLSEAVRLCHAQRLTPEIEDLCPTFQDPGYPQDMMEAQRGLTGSQLEALRGLEKHRFGILSGLPGSGKRLVMLKLALARRLPMLVCVSSVYELHQWKELATRSGIPREMVGLVGGGFEELGRAITLALSSRLKRAQTSARTSEELLVHGTDRDAFRETGLLVIDRVDQGTLGPILRSRAIHCVLQWGLAVGPRSDGLTGLMRAFVGPPVWQMRMDHNVERPSLKVNLTTFECNDGVGEWRDLMKAMAECDDRNRLIAADVLQALAMGQKCLVVSDRGGHLTAIADRIREALGPEMWTLSSDLSPGQREEVVTRFNAGRTRSPLLGLVWRSAALVEELERVDALFIAAPVRQADHLMAIIMRMQKGGVIYEYRDKPWLLRRSLRRRLKVYRGMGIR